MSEPLEPVYLICGSDRPKVLRAVDRLRRNVAAAGGSEELHDALDIEPRAVAGLCEQLGLFGGDRLILVSGVDVWKAEPVKELEPYLAAPTPGTTLALVAGPAMKKDHRLMKGSTASSASRSTCRARRSCRRTCARRRSGSAPASTPRRSAC